MTISVFLADDHAVVRDGLKHLLGAEADIIVVGEAGTGQEAVEQVLTLKPAVVLMDIAMPGLAGIEATHQIVSKNPETRVVILSMHGTNEHLFQAFQAGASGFLLKESAGVEVVKAVRAAVEGRRYLSKKISEGVIDDYFRKREGRDEPHPLERLSLREREVLQHVVEGRSSAEIAEVLFLSPKTVETYRSRIMKKLEIDDIPALVRFAIKEGIIVLD